MPGVSLRRCAALVAVFFLASGCASSGQPDAGGDRFLVALGDSFPAGVGAAGMTGPCIRSPEGWPSLLAGELGWPSENLACSGAKIADVYEQLDDAPPRTEVVVLQVGGNTLGSRELIQLCMEGACEAARALGVERNPRVQTELVDLLREIDTRLPELERLYVVTYPLPTVGTEQCDADVTSEFAAFLTMGTMDLNEAIASAARASAADGAPTVLVDAGAFEGHGVCDDDPWFHSRTVSMLFMHPNDAGHRAIAGTVAGAIVADLKAG